MFKVGDKVRVVNGTDIEGVITLKANNHGLCSSVIYPLPTVNIDRGNGEIWKVNLDDIELVDEGKEKELELWKSAERRYYRIFDILEGVLVGIHADGCKVLGIPGCDFCKEYRSRCKECPWAQVMDKDRPACSSWESVRQKIGDAVNATKEILTKINAQIEKMENPDEV